MDVIQIASEDIEKEIKKEPSRCVKVALIKLRCVATILLFLLASFMIIKDVFLSNETNVNKIMLMMETYLNQTI